MICHDARLLLHAYLDDELDAAQSVAITRHMQGCTACAARFADYNRLRKGLAQASLYRRAPDALRKQWSGQPIVSPSDRAQARTHRPPFALAMAAGFAAALLLAAPAWMYMQHASEQSATVIDEALSSHLRALQPQHLMDVISTDQHTVKPWFAGKLDFSPHVKDLAEEGFPLVGGRLDALEGHSVAALVYKRRLHVIDLYQWPAPASTAAMETTHYHGYTVMHWTADRMRFVAVSDLNEEELRQFALAFQNEAAHL